MSLRKITKENHEQVLETLTGEMRVYGTTDNHKFRTMFADFPTYLYMFASFSCADVSTKDAALVQFYESADMRIKGRLTHIKPGAFIRKIYPVATDQEVEQFTKAFKDTFKQFDLEIVDSNEESAFQEAYTSKLISGANPRLSSGIKSLHSSCMQGSHKCHGGEHPAIAYASGDFRIIFAKDKETGFTLARVVMSEEERIYSPIYTDSDQATKAIQNYLESIEAREGDAGDWDGLSLQKIETRKGVLCPYVDLAHGVSDYGDTLSIGGDYEFSTCGIATLEDDRMTCRGCDERLDEDHYSADDDGYTYCDSCFFERYTYSEHEGCDIPVDDVASDINGVYASVYWFDHNGYVLTESGLYAPESDCVEYLGQWYHKSHDKVIEENGILAHMDSLAYETKEDWQWVWTKTQDHPHYDTLSPSLEFTCSTTTTLRQNYQLDSNGIPERLPELSFV